MIGRLGATQTKASARAAVLAWAQRTTTSNPLETQAVLAILEPAATPIALSFKVLLAFTPLMVAFGLVLLTAAANLAGLMLSRATVRQREIAIRLTLGASRGRIVRQLFVESLLLALVASLAGFALGRLTLDAGIRAVYATLPPTVSEYIRLLPVLPDAYVLAALIAAGIGTAVLFGALPALHATRHPGAISSHGVTPDGPTSRLRHGLVVAQITVSALLIVAACCCAGRYVWPQRTSGCRRAMSSSFAPGTDPTRPCSPRCARIRWFARLLPRRRRRSGRVAC